MRIKEYEENQRKIKLRSDKPRKNVAYASASIKKDYYEKNRESITEESLQHLLDDLFVLGYLTNEIKVTLSFKKQPFGNNDDVFEIDLKVLE